jgi:hypothetical protein
MAAVFCLIPLPRSGLNAALVAKPQVVCGVVWILVFGLCSTFYGNAVDMVDGVLGAVRLGLPWFLFLVVACFVVFAVRQNRWGVLSIASVALLPWVALSMGLAKAEPAANILPVLATVYLGLVGLALILLEFTGRPSAPRTGAALIAVLIVIRMADSHFSLLVKGLVFMAVGAAFLVFNYLMNRRRVPVVGEARS